MAIMNKQKISVSRHISRLLLWILYIFCSLCHECKSSRWLFKGHKAKKTPQTILQAVTTTNVTTSFFICFNTHSRSATSESPARRLRASSELIKYESRFQSQGSMFPSNACMINKVITLLYLSHPCRTGLPSSRNART